MSDDDYEKRDRRYPLSASKMSKTPSWIMVGFLLGAVTVWYLPPRAEKRASPAPVTAPKAESKETVKREAQPLTTIEYVFDEWARYAVWEYDMTEVALWNSKEQAFADFYEVRRYGSPERYYFRSIPALTRRIITRGKEVPNCPLKFTESEEQYQEWRQHGRNDRPFGDQRPLSAFAPEAPRANTIDSQTLRSGVQIAPPAIEPVSPFEPVRKKDSAK